MSKKTKRKPKYKFFVTDWNPNGTQCLVVRHADSLETKDVRDEVLFGIDVAKLGKGICFDNYEDCVEYRVSKKLIKKHVASGPFGMGFEENCMWLAKYIK